MKKNNDRQTSISTATFLLLAATAGLTPLSAAASENYIVLYKGQSVPANAAKTIASAGGTLVYSYAPVGVAITRFDNFSFRNNI